MNDRLIIEETIIQLECAIKTIRFMQDVADPPLYQEMQDELTAFILIKDYEVSHGGRQKTPKKTAKQSATPKNT